MKKRMCLLITVVTAFTMLFGGCSDKKTASKSGQRTLRVEIFERGDVPEGAGSITDNAMTEWIQKTFGDKNNIKLEYVSVPRSAEASQLNISMAAGEAPDIVFTYSYAIMYDFYSKDGLSDLTKYMKVAPNLTKFLGKEILAEGQIDGKQILIPSKRLIRGTTSQLIRQDWLDKLGMQAPTNTDELYTVLKAFKEKDPGNNGSKNIPYGLGFHSPSFTDLLRNFVDSDISEKDRTCIPLVMQPDFKEGLRYMNKLYNDGLISPDFALDKDRKQLDADVSNGYVGFINDDLGRPIQAGGSYEVLKKNVPDAKFSAVDAWVNSNGKYLKNIYSANGLYMAVPKASEDNIDSVLKYLNWMADDDVLRTLQYGFEGKNYKLDEKGLPTILDTPEAKKTHWYNLGFDLALIVNGKYNPDPEKVIDMAATSTVDAELYRDCFKNSIKDGWSFKTLSPDNDDKSLIETTLGDAENEIYVKGITASVGSFDSVADKLINEYKKAGGSELKEINEKLYKQSYGE